MFRHRNEYFHSTANILDAGQYSSDQTMLRVVVVCAKSASRYRYILI